MESENRLTLQSLKRQQTISYLISFVLHALLLLLFFLVKVDWNVSVPEFIEIQFEQGQALRPAIKETPPPPPVESHQPEQFELPERRVELPEPDVLEVNQDAKVVPEEQVSMIPRDITEPERSNPTADRFALGEKQVADINTDAKLSPDMIADVGEIEIESPFKIEGKAALRTILIKTLPKYPENLQQEAVVKIRFTVLPDGIIGDMIPVIKGNNVLESVTMDAFRQWRFNSLPANVPQVTEQGTITFRYILK